MTIYDTILWLESQATGRRFPMAQFSADTDMATAGWVSLTSIASHEIVVAQMTAEEYNAGEPFEYTLLENRINAALHRADLRVPWLVQVEERGPEATGLSFQDFSKAYRPPRLLYRDIFAEGSLAEKVSEMSRESFERGGGKLVAYEA